MSYEYDAYIVRLDPQDDNGYAHIVRLASFMGESSVKLLSPAEGDELRELLLADGQLGKKVGINGIHGEGYIVLSTFPRINELHNFFRSLPGKGMNYSEFISMNNKKKAAATVKVSKGGSRSRSSLRKSSKRSSRKKSRMSRRR